MYLFVCRDRTTNVWSTVVCLCRSFIMLFTGTDKYIDDKYIADKYIVMNGVPFLFAFFFIYFNLILLLFT